MALRNTRSEPRSDQKQGSGQEKQTQTDARAFESNSVRAGDCDLTENFFEL